ncbi:hypothetical protein [Halogeometricum limi]|uniref:Predicted RNA-binding protein, contains TRAM domain n=1 Tax=Halogeometricum limi TaxID=555875 RepID=A0A1I6HVJ3_9EURY|nr:hypothetical protein [Halogeometricum limi]SFR58428.1 Predicted RNA-binding protein, contains TRAM domain [Halogeometricum limi]
MVAPYLAGLAAVVGAVKVAQKVRKRNSAGSQTSSSHSTDTKKAFITAVRDEGVVIGEKRYFSEGEASQTSYKVETRESNEIEDILKKEVIRAYERAEEEGAEMSVGDFTDDIEKSDSGEYGEETRFSAGASDSSITPDEPNNKVEESYMAHKDAQEREPPVELGGVYEILLEEETDHHSGRRDLRGTYQGFQIFVKDVPEDIAVDDVVNVKITSFSRKNTAAKAKIASR